MTKHIRGSRMLAALVCILYIMSQFSAIAATYPYDTTCMENVNLRKSAKSSAEILKRIQAGETITVLGITGSYYKVRYNGITGYAMRQYVNGTSNTPDEAPGTIVYLPPPSAVDSYPYDTTTKANAKLREVADVSANVLAAIPMDTAITVEEVTTTGFAKVRYQGKTGYVIGTLVHLFDITAPPSTADAEAYLYYSLENGSTGSMVRALQEALAELGYYTGKVDSKYGSGTFAAVNAFKKKNKMVEDGVADAAMQKLLFEGKPVNSKGSRKAVKTVPLVAGMTIASNDTGEAVERLQTRLRELGYYSGDISGVCDKATVAAIKDFQKKHALKASGKADPETQNVLYGAAALSLTDVVTPTPAPTVRPPSGTVREGDVGEDAKAVQQRLKDLGYYTGRVDGKFGKSSVKALKAFQEKSALQPDGVCGSKTIEALFGGTAAYAKATAVPLVATMAPITQENVVVIKAGSRGNAVLNLQQRLMDLDYYASRLDGVYLEDDISAVRAFQRANGLQVDGKAGYQTQSLLFSDGALRNATGISMTEALRYGSVGSEVMALQNRLIELGYLTSAADGTFGRGTKAAVMDFQKASGLAKDGVAGAETQAAIHSSEAVRKAVSVNTILKEGSVSSAVKDLQNRLIALGYMSGKADGKFGQNTSLALIAFQKRNKLTADGVAGTVTLAALNSTTAKLASGASAVATPKPDAIWLSSAPRAATVRYANWYSEVRARCKLYPNVTIYDFTTGANWQVNIFSNGAHADAEPITANDTATMNQAFGGKTTWTPKAVWVVFSDGRVYMASTHNTPHDTSHKRDNDFSGHLCIHFPRTEAQVSSIGPYATSHQKAIDQGWEATQIMAAQQY